MDSATKLVVEGTNPLATFNTKNNSVFIHGNHRIGGDTSPAKLNVSYFDEDSNSDVTVFNINTTAKFVTSVASFLVIGSDDISKFTVMDEDAMPVFGVNTNNKIVTNFGDLLVSGPSTSKLMVTDGTNNPALVVDTTNNIVTTRILAIDPNSEVTTGISELYMDTTGKVGKNTSDINVKTDLSELEVGSDFVNSITPYKFHYKTNPEGPWYYGFTAQNLLENLNEPTNLVPEKTGEYYNVNHYQLIAPMVKAIQQLSEQVQQLMTKNIALEQQLQQLLNP